MLESRAKRRLIAIVSLGIALCTVGMGVRIFHRKPLHGTWLGYSMMKSDGKNIKDEQAGQFQIRLNKDGTYIENGNSTSGTWKREGDQITLIPVKFFDKTPEELMSKYRKKDGSTSVTIKTLLKTNMKPIAVTYHAGADILVIDEPTLRYEYKRE